MKFRIKRYVTLLGTLVACFLLGCQSPTPAESPPSEEASPVETPQPRGPKPQPTTAHKSAPFKLPIPWSGTGVLVASDNILARNAPDWARRAQLEIVLSEGVYFLRATSQAKNINNPSLLEQSAANRARALLQTTLKLPTLSHSQLFRRWKNPKKAEMIVQIQTPIPSEWAQVAPEPGSMKDSSP